MDNKNKVNLFVFFSVFLFTANVQSNDSEKKTLEQSKNNMEKIEVVGQRPASFYKRLMYKAQDEFLDTYNNLTDIEDFKMECKKHYVSDVSRIQRRRCVAGYENNASLHKESPALAAMKQRRASEERRPLVSPFEMKKKKKAQVEDIKEKLASSPELTEKYLKWIEAELEYQKRKQ